jgi:hypothetical protein
MAGVSGSIDVNITAKVTGAADLGNPVAPVRVAKHIDIVAGTAATNQDDVLFADTRTLAASTTENLDLAGVLAGLLGGTITAAEITAIYVEADPGNTNDVLVGGAASNAFNGPLSGTTPKLQVGPGDCALVTNKKGWTVTAGTGDILLVGNSGAGTSVTYTIVVIGRTVAA